MSVKVQVFTDFSCDSVLMKTLLSLKGIKGALGDPGLPGPTGLRGGFGERVSTDGFWFWHKHICTCLMEHICKWCYSYCIFQHCWNHTWHLQTELSRTLSKLTMEMNVETSLILCMSHLSHFVSFLFTNVPHHLQTCCFSINSYNNSMNIQYQLWINHDQLNYELFRFYYEWFCIHNTFQM